MMSDEAGGEVVIIGTEEDAWRAEFMRQLFEAIEKAGGVPVDLREPFDGGPDIVPCQSHERREKG